MPKYGEKAQEIVHEKMHEMKEGELKSGISGKKVTSQKQTVAIALSEARKEGVKVPKRLALVVGHLGLEPRTSVLSGPRSNQLS